MIKKEYDTYYLEPCSEGLACLIEDRDLLSNNILFIKFFRLFKLFKSHIFPNAVNVLLQHLIIIILDHTLNALERKHIFCCVYSDQRWQYREGNQKPPAEVIQFTLIEEQPKHITQENTKDDEELVETAGWSTH